MKVKAASDADRDAAVASAIEKAKAEFEKAGAASNSEDSKRHGEELRALEEKLKAQHEEEMRTAVENARKEQATATVDPAVVDAAIAEHKAALESKHTADIEAAVERGRIEQAAKSKLKDNQLAKTQKKVKELEAQVLKWKEAGYIPAEEQAPKIPAAPSPVPSATPAAASGSTLAPPQTSSSAPPTVPTVPVRKLGQGTTVTGGVGRGAPTVRQQRGSSLPSRGGGTARPAGTLSIAGASSSTGATTTANQAGGLNIMGASKRPREEQSGAGDDSLAKRIKPAEVPSKPAAMLRRLPPQQQPQPPAS